MNRKVSRPSRETGSDQPASLLSLIDLSIEVVVTVSCLDSLLFFNNPVGIQPLTIENDITHMQANLCDHSSLKLLSSRKPINRTPFAFSEGGYLVSLCFTLLGYKFPSIFRIYGSILYTANSKLLSW